MKKGVFIKTKRCCCSFIAAVIMLLVLSSACARIDYSKADQNSDPGAKIDDLNVVLPPEAVNAGTIEALIEYCPFDYCVENADLIAFITIGNWLEESQINSFSVYEATVNEVYKGESSEKIVLHQDGCSTAQYKGYPLFKAGDELLLFLKAVSEESGEIFYYIIGSFSTVLTAVYDEAGNRYYADYHGLIRDTAKGLKPVYISYENLNKANGASLLSDPKALFLANEMKTMIVESL